MKKKAKALSMRVRTGEKKGGRSKIGRLRKARTTKEIVLSKGNKERILETAKRLFGELGYADTTYKRIAQKRASRTGSSPTTTEARKICSNWWKSPF